MNILSLVYFILILGIIVLVHEFGHFLFAKIFGIYVYEFSIGMGPKLFSKKGKGGETYYSIRAIPLGGYVSLAGEEVDDDAKIPADRKLQAKPAWQRFLVMFFGAGNNFILALLLLFAIGLCFGSVDQTPYISSVVEGFPAAEAGISANDKVLEINDHNISSIDDISLYVTLADKEEPIEFVVEKENGDIETYQVKAKKQTTEEGTSYVVGITMEGKEEKGFLAAIKYSFSKMKSIFKQMFVVIGNLITGGLSINSLSGPVGIYNVVDQQAKTGLANMLYLVAYLSINVGVINLIPLPAFDGGRILFLIIEKIKGSPVKPSTENLIHNIGFILLLLLMIYVTIHDIITIF